MRVSLNEMQTLCEKVLFCFKNSYAESDRIAKMVTSLQMMKLNGVDKFIEAIKYLPKNSEIKIKDKGKNIYVNLQDSSLIYSFPALIDFCLYRLQSTDKLHLQLNHCKSQWLAIEQLSQLAKQGLFIYAKWYDKDYHQTIVCTIGPNQFQPDIYFEKEEIDKQKFDLLMSKSTIKTPKFESCYLTSLQLSKRFDESVKQGIFIHKKDWLYLKKLVLTTMVKPSDSSRLDAG